MPRVTMRDVAARAGVSTKTVSLVLNKNGFVSEALTQRVTNAMRELDYRPDRVARSLRRQSTETVGVIFSSFISPFYPAVLAEMERILSARGLGVLFANAKGNEQHEASVISVMREKRVDGLLVSPHTGANLPILEELVRESVPVVTFHNAFAAGRIDCVTWDDFGGSRRAVQHLIESGRRRIAILTSRIPGLLPRFRGYEAALQEAGISPDPSLCFIRTTDPIVQNTSVFEGREAILHLLHQPNPPDAVFVASSSFVTLGVLDGVKSAGARVPQDLAIVSYDNYPWTEYLTPPLSAVARNGTSLGSAAAELLLQRLKERSARHPETIVVPTELIVRASSVAGPP